MLKWFWRYDAQFILHWLWRRTSALCRYGIWRASGCSDTRPKQLFLSFYATLGEYADLDSFRVIGIDLPGFGLVIHPITDASRGFCFQSHFTGAVAAVLEHAVILVWSEFTRRHVVLEFSHDVRTSAIDDVDGPNCLCLGLHYATLCRGALVWEQYLTFAWGISRIAWRCCHYRFIIKSAAEQLV